MDWTVSLIQSDKNPYGAYVLYNSLRDYFPEAEINSFRKPPYNVVSEEAVSAQTPSAYFMLSPQLKFSQSDMNALFRFVKKGNFAFLSSTQISKNLLDSLGLKSARPQPLEKDSTKINFTNPALRKNNGYTFRKYTIDDDFQDKIKNKSAVVLGITEQKNNPNFIKFKIGKGALFVHAAPLCFSNIFLLTEENADYVNKAISYIPKNIQTVYWDEYYKQGREGASSPLRVLLSNFWTRWALRIALLLLLTYILFGIKRKQRIIPVIKPLENKSLSFAETVSALYFSKKENKLIVHKKNFLLDFIKHRYGMNSRSFNDEFIEILSRKSSVKKELVKEIFSQAAKFQTVVTDKELITFNKKLEQFYQQAKA